jgi:hypothetical protein
VDAKAVSRGMGFEGVSRPFYEFGKRGCYGAGIGEEPRVVYKS